jgi:hypothetical protein
LAQVAAQSGAAVSERPVHPGATQGVAGIT